jgi:hypothetical protein
MKTRVPSFLLAGVLALAAAVSAGSCAEADPDTASVSLAATGANPDVYVFAMGNTNQPVGEIRVWNDDTTLYVQYVMYLPYALTDAHVCVSTADFPWTAPGQCPYTIDGLPGVSEWVFAIPLADLGATCGTLLYLQVHGSVMSMDTGTGVGSAYAGTFKGRIAYLVTCDPPPEGGGCTLTQGYWKTHSGAWPVSSLAIGGVTYSKSQLIGLLKTPPRGDASIILAHQLIAALLNVANGAVADPETDAALLGAEAWMTAAKDADGTLPYGIRPTAEGEPNPAAWDEAINLAAVLDRFNNGELGPPHCE